LDTLLRFVAWMLHGTARGEIQLQSAALQAC